MAASLERPAVQLGQTENEAQLPVATAVEMQPMAVEQLASATQAPVAATQPHVSGFCTSRPRQSLRQVMLVCTLSSSKDHSWATHSHVSRTLGAKRSLQPLRGLSNRSP